jgi:hypothetical protein
VRVLLWAVKVMVIFAAVGTIHEAGWGEARFGLILAGIFVVWLGTVVVALLDDQPRERQ